MKKMRNFRASPPKVLPGDEVYVLNTRYKEARWEHGTVIRVEAHIFPGTKEGTYTLLYSYAVRLKRKSTKNDYLFVYAVDEQIEPYTVEDV